MYQFFPFVMQRCTEYSRHFVQTFADDDATIDDGNINTQKNIIMCVLFGRLVVNFVQWY